MKRGKKYQDAVKAYDRSAQYDVAEAIDLVKKNATAKFDETIELHLRTGCDGRHAVLLIVEEEKLAPVFDMAKHYGLDCAIVGVMTDSKRYRVYKNGVLEADLPTSILGDTPEVFWPSEEPKDLPERQALDLSTLKCEDAGKELISMLSCPNGRRKNAIWEQYDSMVQLHTIAGPGEPAAIVEVPETERACVLTMEAEPYKCWTNPYTGAAEAMALSLRGVWLSGADGVKEIVRTGISALERD